jgi:5'-3' exonuclease
MTILIDGNSRGRAHHDATKLTVGSFQTQAIFGFLKEMRQLHFTFPHRQIIVLWDGHAKWRYDLYPEYKSNRTGKSEVDDAHRAAYKAQVPWIQQSLSRLGVRQLLNLDAEADDLAGFMAFRIKGPVLLLTGDHDWMQMVGTKVTWLDPRNGGKKVTPDNFFEMTGYKDVNAFLDGKCLHGDTSDTIKGTGIGEKHAPEFIAEFGSVARFFQMVDDGTYVPKLAKYKKLASPEGRAIFERNKKLMSLLDVAEPPKDRYHDFKRKTEPDHEAFKKICSKLGFVSILKDYDNFVEPFKPRVAA